MVGGGGGVGCGGGGSGGVVEKRGFDDGVWAFDGVLNGGWVWGYGVWDLMLMRMIPRSSNARLID